MAQTRVMSVTYASERGTRKEFAEGRFKSEMVGPNGLEPSTSSVSRKRSNQTELRAYEVGSLLV